MMSTQAKALFDHFRIGASYQNTCACGKFYFDNSADAGYDWDDGEQERLVEDKEAIACDGSITVARIEGRDVVDWCDCWQERFDQIASFLKSHRSGIASFLNAERARAVRDATELAEIKTGTTT